MEPIRVFIVDDDKDFAEGLAIALEGNGCDVETAFSGEDAIRVFREKDFDIAFMDVKLPGMNGVESFLEIRKFKSDARVVMMTGYSVEQLLDQAVENGARGILHKPVDMSEVLKMIEKVGQNGILIADDDPDFVAGIKDILLSNGYNVFVAKNGEEAINRVTSNNIDVLILDLRMPVLDGLETYLKLKRTGHLVPTIIVTAFADEEQNAINELCKGPACGILRKPFDPKRLLENIDILLKKKQEINHGS